jgi:hypothetical protein
MRRIRILGLAITAVFALSAVAASAASATLFEAETYPVTVKAEGTGQEFTVESGTINCKGTFEGALPLPLKAEETLKVNPAYTECKFAALGITEVKMNGCQFKLHTNGVVDVECPTGKVIEVHTLTCDVKVGTQLGLKSVTYKNLNEAQFGKGASPFAEVEVTSNVEKIKYEESTGCTKPGTHENGVYKGKVIAQGFNEALAQEGIRVH